MKLRFLVLLCAAFLGVYSPAMAEDAVKHAPAFEQGAKKAFDTYEELVKASYKMQADYDFAALREAFVALPVYKPYHLNPSTNFKALQQQLQTQGEGDEKGAGGKMINVYIQKHFALPQAHALIASVAKDGDITHRYHGYMHNGLMKALEKSGDGKSAETAYKVLVISEEYLLARRVFGEEKVTQELKHIGDKSYDILTAKDPETGEERSIWFDITKIYGSPI